MQSTAGSYQQSPAHPHHAVTYLAATLQERAEILNLHLNWWIPVFTIINILLMPAEAQLFPANVGHLP